MEKKPTFQPTRFMLPTSHYDKQKADKAVAFIQSLKHTTGVWAGKPFKLLRWQEQIIRDIFGVVKENGYRQFRDVFVETGKKNGKQLALDTPIPTPGGWTTMGELRVGDQVFDEKGVPCSVVALSPIDDEEQCYAITFRDGSVIRAGERHLWDIEKQTSHGYRAYQVTTGDLYKSYMQIKNSREHRSPARIHVSQPIKTPDAELPIDPYTYGYWLGNGNSVKPELTVCVADKDELLSYIPYTPTSIWHNVGESYCMRIPELKKILVKSFREKRIPPEYLRASENQRWALLQGLMDSDGHISKEKSQSVYVSTNKQLAEDVRELLWSLGIKNAMTEEPSHYRKKPTGETLYTIRFTTFADQPTSKLHRKIERKRERVKKTRSCFHYIADIQPISEKVQMRCIQVDSPSHEYLAGRSFVPTHNSELAAAIALYMLCADGEMSAQIYGCANDRGQASIVFNVARDMVRYSEHLMERIKIVESQKRLVYVPTNSFYAAVSTEVATKFGLNISCCVFDELLGQQTRDFFDTMTKGAGAARKQPLNFIITTAGNDKTSICYEVHSKAVDILEGRKSDPTFYPVIFGADENDDWTDPEVWKKANPSLGVTVDLEYYRERCESAKENPAEEIQFRQFHLNQWTNTSVRWMPMDKWDDCGVDIALNDLAGRECYAGLDLSSTSDLTAFVLVFPPLENEPYIAKPFFWLPEETIPLRVRRDHVMYDVWAKQKFLQTTEGNVVHYAFIEEFINELHKNVNIKEIAYDRWNASMMVQALQGDGFTMVPFGMGFRDQSQPTKDLMRFILSKELAHDKNPVLRWNIDNVYVSSDPAGNIKMNKEKSTEKIDGAIALVMALDRAQRRMTDSIYNHRDLLVL